MLASFRSSRIILPAPPTETDGRRQTIPQTFLAAIGSRGPQLGYQDASVHASLERPGSGAQLRSRGPHHLSCLWDKSPAQPRFPSFFFVTNHRPSPCVPEANRWVAPLKALRPSPGHPRPLPLLDRSFRAAAGCRKLFCKEDDLLGWSSFAHCSVHVSACT